MKIKGLVKNIKEKNDFKFSGIDTKIMSGAILELKTEDGGMVHVDFPNYHAGSNRPFLIGSQVEYIHISAACGEKERVHAEKYVLKILTGKLKDEQFKTVFSY